jgi:hypothetical protein
MTKVIAFYIYSGADGWGAVICAVDLRYDLCIGTHGTSKSHLALIDVLPVVFANG